MTGADYLIASAAEGARRGDPFAEEFSKLARAAALGPTAVALSPEEVLAGRSLTDAEKAAVQALYVAYQTASRFGDEQAVEETLALGVGLVAKFCGYQARHGN